MKFALLQRWTWRLALARLLLVIGMPMLFLVLMELFARPFLRLPPRTFFVEFEQEGATWVTDNPHFGLTFQHPQQARHPAQNRFSKQKDPETFRILILGESAAMGFPRPEFGLARMVAAHLRWHWPDQSVEVIDGTMTLINSHILREIAREAMAYQPDLIVVYAGNNEVIGPYGPAGVFGYPFKQMSLIRLDRWLRRNSHLFARLSRDRIAHQFADEQRWRGLDHFEETAMDAADPALDRVARFFRRNIQSIVRQAERRRIPVVLATPAVNLKDWPPLQSLSNPQASESADWHDFRDRAYSALADEEWATAGALADDWLRAFPGCADAAYVRARSVAGQGKWELARQWDEIACSWDAYRFRATAEISAQLHGLAGQGAVPSIAWVDTRSRLYEEGGSDASLFLEHVHLTVRGMHVLAREIVEGLHPLFPDRSHREAAAATFADVAERLFFLPDINAESWEAALEFLEMTVFRAQHGYEARLFRMQQDHQLAQSHAAEIGVSEVLVRHQLAQGAATSPGWLLDFLLGRYLIRRGAVAESVAPLQRAVARKPNHALIHEWLGFAYYHTDRKAAAITTLQAGLAINPFLPESLNTLGLSYFRQGDSEKAEGLYERALAIDPGHAGAWNNLGYLWLQQGRLVEARQALEEALRALPDSLEAGFHLALVLQAQERHREAATQLEQVTEQHPSLARAWVSWATVLGELGDYEAAVEKIDRALALEPERHDARLLRAHWWITQLDQPLQALSDLEPMVVRFPTHSAVRYLYGLALVATGAKEDGVDHVEWALAAAPQQWDWYLEAARLFRQQSNDIAQQRALEWVAHVLHQSGHRHVEAAHLLDQWQE